MVAPIIIPGIRQLRLQQICLPEILFFRLTIFRLFAAGKNFDYYSITNKLWKKKKPGTIQP
jgi:hypothetical protein